MITLHIYFRTSKDYEGEDYLSAMYLTATNLSRFDIVKKELEEKTNYPATKENYYCLENMPSKAPPLPPGYEGCTTAGLYTIALHTEHDDEPIYSTIN